MANTVAIKITADAKQAKDELDSIDKHANAIGGSAKVAGAALLGLGALGAAGLATSVNAAANFEQAIDAVGAVSQATEADMAKLSDTALRIGKDTAFSASEAASAMYELAAQGVSTTDIIGGAADAVVALAAAGGTDLVTAATAASSAMNIWKLSTADMPEVVNRLTGAANVSAFGIEDMVLGMAAGGIAASTFKISMEDTTTALAALSKGGFQNGSDAGTSFKAMLTGLAAPTGAGAKAIARLGVEVRDSSGEMKDIAGIIDELNTKLGALSSADRDKAMAQIFGSDGMRAAAALMQMTGSEFEAMSAKMESTDAAGIAAQRMDNFKGSMEQLKGSIETVQIEIGSRLLPVLTSLATFAAENLPGAFAATEAAITKAVEFVKPKLQEFADFASEKFKEFQGYYESDIKPATDNIVAAIKYVVDWVAEHWPEISRVVMPVLELIKIQIETAKDVIVNVLQIIIDLISGDWAGAWNNMKELFGSLRDYVAETFGNLKELMSGMISILFDIAKYVGKAILNGIKAGIEEGWGAFKGWVTDKLDPRNWDIPGLSPFLDAYEHAGQMGGRSLIRGVVGGIAESGGDPGRALSGTLLNRPGGINVDTLPSKFNGISVGQMTPWEFAQMIQEITMRDYLESPWGSGPTNPRGPGGSTIIINAPMGDGASIRRMMPTYQREQQRIASTYRRGA